MGKHKVKRQRKVFDYVGSLWSASPLSGIHCAHAANLLLDRATMEPNTGCWLWLGCVDKRNYGKTVVGNKSYLAHRLAFEIFNGPLPEDYTVDHLCWQTLCVNPMHLEAKTRVDNSKRQRSALKSFCIRGHEFDDGNTYFRPDYDKPSGKRTCRKCNLMRNRETRNKAAAAE